MFIDQKIEKKIDDLIAQMTLEEKIGQLCQCGPSPVGAFEISEEQAALMLKDGSISQAMYDAIVNHTAGDSFDDLVRKGKIGSIVGDPDAATTNRLQKIAVEESRLGIPMIRGVDVIHGHKTIFPIPLAQACSFEDETFVTSTSIAAKEAVEDGIHWTYAPMVDVAHDARWGRITEGFGEDPYLGYRYAQASVKGFQGETIDDLKKPGHLAACAKHFAGYGAVEGGRDYDTVDMSLPKFFEQYLPPYAGAVKAGVATVMAAFNDLNGVPATTNKWLLTDLLRDKMGFEGFVSSDANAVSEVVNHGTASNAREAVKQAINAGLDFDLCSNVYADFLPDLIRSGEVSMETLETAVRRVLRIKFQMGIFDHPYVEIPEKSCKRCPEHLEKAREIARKSIVLLKNESGLLPLSKKEKIAVIGEIAANKDAMFGSWACFPDWGTAVSLADGLTNAGIDFVYAPCVSEKLPLDRELLATTVKDTDTVIACLEHYGEGEADSNSRLEFKGEQIEMLKELKKMGKKVIAVMFNERPMALADVVPNCDTLVEAWPLGSEAGNAICDVLFGDYDVVGRLTATMQYYTGQWPVYYNHPNTGRPTGEARWTCKYNDAPLYPLYSFGYGLSYTTFAYSDMAVQVDVDKLHVTVKVKNTGDRTGTETVQCYIHRHKATRVRPVKELKGYAKVTLTPGEEKNVTIELTRELLGYFNEYAEYIMDESNFDIWMAHDSTCELGCHQVITF